jgi:16S rRNA processing protein RimM
MTHDNQILILVGKILSPHGINGMVKIMSYMSVSKDLFNHNILTSDNKTIVIESNKAISPSTFICKIKDINNRNQSEEIKGLELFITKDNLPELQKDEFYIEDLKGMQVVDIYGKTIGLINNVYNFGAGDIIEIKFNGGAVEMYDFNSKIFPQIDDKVTFVAPQTL